MFVYTSVNSQMQAVLLTIDEQKKKNLKKEK